MIIRRTFVLLITAGTAMASLAQGVLADLDRMRGACATQKVAEIRAQCFEQLSYKANLEVAALTLKQSQPTKTAAQIAEEETRAIWELWSFRATAVVAVLALGFVGYQARMQRQQQRRDALWALYADFDKPEAREARYEIYKAPQEALRLASLPIDSKMRAHVDETLAMLERMAYAMVRRYIPAEDAFNLYGGVLLQTCSKLWPYVEDQRRDREANPATHRLEYRRFLEEAIRKWHTKYSREMARPRETRDAVRVILERLFPVPSRPNGGSDAASGGGSNSKPCIAPPS